MSKEKKVGFCPERLQPTHELPSLCICVQSYLPITSLSRDRQVSEHVCHPLLNCKELASVGSLDWRTWESNVQESWLIMWGSQFYPTERNGRADHACMPYMEHTVVAINMSNNNGVGFQVVEREEENKTLTPAHQSSNQTSSDHRLSISIMLASL